MNFKLILPAVLALSAVSHAQNKTAAEPPLITSLKGPELYQAYCAVCHGQDAKGNGPMSKALKTAPPDLTHLATNGIYPRPKVVICEINLCQQFPNRTSRLFSTYIYVLRTQR